jgi:hypothetical protein
MIHGLFAAVVSDPIRFNSRPIRSLRAPFVLSNASAVLEAVTPIHQSVAVSVFCRPLIPSGRKPEVYQYPIGRRHVCHGDAIPLNGLGAPFSDELLFPFERSHKFLSGE